MKLTQMYTSSMHLHVRYHLYEPKVVLRVKGLIQIHHGLGEHADLYDHFASFLLDHGFVVVVSDFAGHGKSLIDFEQGYFGKENGPENLVKDMQHLLEIMRRKYPDVPYFMLGTDLGSLLIRKYISTYGDYIDGVLLLGTMSRVDHQWLKRSYLYMLKTFKGPLYKANQFFKSYHRINNKKINHDCDGIDWMIQDASEQQKFLNDPMTHFSYTVQGYRDIVSIIKEVNSEESISKIPSYLSIYFGYGENDPLARGIDKLKEKYKKYNFSDLTFQEFPQCRHTVLFDQKKKEVYHEILKWLEDRTYL